MAPPTDTRNKTQHDRRTLLRIGIAVVLLATAIAIMIALSQRKPELAEPARQQPTFQESISSAEMEAVHAEQAIEDTSETPPATPPEPEITTYPPPPPVPGELPAPVKRSATTAQNSVVTEKPPAISSIQPPTRSKPMPASYEVQLGVFTDMDNVRQFQGRLTQLGIASHTETRVQIGPFKTRAEAEKAKKSLESHGISAVIHGK